MKKIIVFLFVIQSVVMFSQKIDVKKEFILWDKKEIAKFSEPYNDHIVITDLQGEKALEVTYKRLPGKVDFGFQWLIVTAENGAKKSEIEYEVLLTSFNSKRIIMHLLAVKYNLFNQEGINKAEFDNFFAKNKENLTDKYTNMVVKEKLETSQNEEQKKVVIARYTPKVNPDKSISFYSGSAKRMAGKLYTKPYQVGMGAGQDYISAYDLDNNFVAKLFSTSDFNKYKVEAWDGNIFEYTIKSVYSDQNFTFLDDFVVQLLSRGYLFENDIKVKRAELLNAKVATAKSMSVNLYNKKGYLVDKDGIKYSGQIDILFQQLDLNNTGEKLPEFGPDNYGQKVIVTYKNEKGSERKKTFNAIDNNYFVVIENNVEVFYYGLKTKGEFGKKMQNIDSFKFNSAYYYKLIKKGKNIMLLQDPVEPEKYVIKTDSQDKGQMIDTRSNEKLAKVLSEYLNDCKSVSTSISNLEFDLKIESNLLTIINEYSDCKK